MFQEQKKATIELMTQLKTSGNLNNQAQMKLDTVLEKQRELQEKSVAKGFKGALAAT